MSSRGSADYESLLEAAARLQPDERASYLAEACSDPELAEEITRTLSGEESGRSRAFARNPSSADTRLGKVFGNYLVTRLIGSGGMGEVYLATDQRLGRRVALKFLPPALMQDSAMVRRFQQEARTTSALNHPNIVTVHDIGEQDGEFFIASEFIEGVTLRARLRQGPLPQAQAIEIGVQIASALVAAHRVGITHRDLKPTNVMLREDGYVKVIDFGLAKLAARGGSQPAEESRTRPGVLIGTVHYMSPEQARGGATDSRTDIWSTGIILYEMLHGERPFRGSTDSHIIVAILEQPAPLRLRGGSPAVNEIVARCLQKDPDQRYASASELLEALREAARGRREVTVSLLRSVRRTASSSSRPLVMAMLVTVLLIALGAAWLLWTPPRAQWLEVAETRRLPLSGRTLHAVLSPDGKQLAYVTSAGGEQQLYVRDLSEDFEPILVSAAVKDCLGLAFSHEGGQLYFVKQDASLMGWLYRYTLATRGLAFILQDIDGPPVFSPDNTRLAFLRNVPGENGNRAQLLVANLDAVNAPKPMVDAMDLTIGKQLSWARRRELIASIAFNAGARGAAQPHLLLSNPLDGRSRQQLLSDYRSVKSPLWTPDDRTVVFAASRPGDNDDISRLVQYDVRTEKLRDVRSDNALYEDLSLTGDGHLLAAIRSETPSDIYLADGGQPDRVRRLTNDNDNFAGLAWLRRDRLIAASNRNGSCNLWSVAAADGGAAQLTNVQAVDRNPDYNPAENAVVFASNRGAGSRFHIYRLDVGSGRVTQLSTGANYDDAPTVAAGGRWVVYTSWPRNLPSLWKIPLKGGIPVELFRGQARNPRMSPDGSEVACEFRPHQNDPWQLAVVSAEDGRLLHNLGGLPPNDSLPNPGPKGARFEWSADGRSLLIVKTDGRAANLWRKAVTGEGTPDAQVTHFEDGRILGFSVSPDGRQIALLRGQPFRGVMLFELTPRRN